jgi:hypothetical protein
MLSFLRKARDSEAWRAINDILAIQALVGLLVGAVSSVTAWIHGQPIYVVLFWGFATSVVAFGAVHILLDLLDKKKQTQQLEPTSPPSNEPNLVFQTLEVGGIGLENDLWLHGGGPNAQRYRAWMLPIKNEMLPGKDVGKAEGIKAEVIVSTGGAVLCEWSPARWVGEKSKSVEIPVSETKELIIAVRDVAPGGFWEMDFKGIPVGTRVGELKIRLLREDSSGTTRLIAKRFYKWRRVPELFDFDIKP